MNKNIKICSKGDISKSNSQMCQSQKVKSLGCICKCLRSTPVKVLDSIKAQEKIFKKKDIFDHIKIMTEIRCLEHEKQSLISDTQ